MQVNILWRGKAAHSAENCLVDAGLYEVNIQSVIVGVHQGHLFQVRYTIRLNAFWRVKQCDIALRYRNKIKQLELIREDNDTWLMNGDAAPEFNGCTDLDLPLTPFTNSLPINRLKLKAGQEKLVDVVYVDLLEDEIKPVRQLYRHVSKGVYHYENVPNDFEADITVDDDGLVLDYPGLFIREASEKSSYPVSYE